LPIKIMPVYVPQVYDFLLRTDAARRPLDWRFQRAVELSRNAPRHRYARRGDDEVISRYADLLYRVTDHTSFDDFARIRKRHPDLAEVYVAYAVMNKTELALMDGLLLSRSVDPNLVRKQSGLTDAQQKLYKKLFLDVDDRRDMSIFIASQLMEPSRLRGTALEKKEGTDPEAVDHIKQPADNGTLSLRAQCTLKVIGFYSSPVVLEMVYSGFLMGTIPGGRDSAVRFINQAALSSVRGTGYLAMRELAALPEGIMEIFKMAGKLAVEEKEEGQTDIIESVEAFFGLVRPRIGCAGTILQTEQTPEFVFDMPYEYADGEIIEARDSGNTPATIPVVAGCAP
jgi:hypothetical protein